MPIELVCFGFSIVGGLIGMLLFCLIWEDGFRSAEKTHARSQRNSDGGPK